MHKETRQSHSGKKHIKKKQDKATAARNVWRRNKKKLQWQETHEEETRQSHNGRDCMKEKQDKIIKGSKNAWRERSQRTRSGVAKGLSTCNPTNAREARLTTEEEQRVWFDEGGKIPSFGILPRPLWGGTLLGKYTYQNG